MPSRYFDFVFRWSKRRHPTLTSLRRHIAEFSEWRGPLQWKFSGPLSMRNSWWRSIGRDMKRARRLDMIFAYFAPPGAMIRRIQRESFVALSGPRTLLMQAAHPVAFTGFFAHTGALDDPYGRLQRTVRVLGLIGFGDKREAQKATARVRDIHTRIHGVLPEAAGRFPAGTPYSATDPDLLLWILACMADSALVVYQRYVRSLGRWRLYATRQAPHFVTSPSPAIRSSSLWPQGRGVFSRSSIHCLNCASVSGVMMAIWAFSVAPPPTARRRRVLVL